MVRQIVINRENKTVDKGIMGFHDYITKYEDFDCFVKRVTDIANDCGNVISISYPSDSVAIIAYWVE